MSDQGAQPCIDSNATGGSGEESEGHRLRYTRRHESRSSRDCRTDASRETDACVRATPRPRGFALVRFGRCHAASALAVGQLAPPSTHVEGPGIQGWCRVVRCSCASS